MVQAPEPPAANKQPPQMTVNDPMRDGAVFNQPIDDQSLTATDFPIMDAGGESSTPNSAGRDVPIRNTSSTSLALSRTSSEARLGSATEPTSGQPPQKRQQRKLTKPRGNSDTNLERQNTGQIKPRVDEGVTEKLSIEKTVDRPRGVLTKKDRQSKSSTAATEDGEGPENTPPMSKDETNASASANGPAPPQSSSLRDRFFPG